MKTRRDVRAEPITIVLDQFVVGEEEIEEHEEAGDLCYEGEDRS